MKAKELLEKEIPTIAKAMGHGELTKEAYAQVWEECYAQVLYVPSANRFTRASVTSRKDKIESYEKKLEANRFHMSKEAKKATKLEQRLRITLGGYQVIISNYFIFFSFSQYHYPLIYSFDSSRELKPSSSHCKMCTIKSRPKK